MKSLQGRIALALVLIAAPAGAQSAVFNACYVPSIGAIYLINRTGLPSACLTTNHVALTWTDGAIADGAITIPKLSFDPATQVELDAFKTLLASAGVLNDAANPIDYTRLKNVPAAAGGDITTVTAGSGLAGGGTTGDVTLTVSFSGPGAATTLSRSDHDHSLANNNTAIGAFALPSTAGLDNTAMGISALQNNTSGESNTAVGALALQANTTGGTNSAFGRRALMSNSIGIGNTGIGYRALFANTSDYNTALGRASLENNTTGRENTVVGMAAMNDNVSSSWNSALGAFALDKHTTGDYNIAVGLAAMGLGTTGTGNVAVGVATLHTTTGDFNIAIGSEAGHELVTGSRNIYIGHSGLATEDDRIRIGRTDNAAFRTFIAGIHGVTTGGAGVAVLIDSDGQLGTVSSSRRFKEDISDMGDLSRKLLDLRPVQFRYKQPAKDGSKPLQYGLVAEEVAEHMPQLVDFDSAGTPTTVYYHVLPTLLLNEIQRQEREMAALRKSVAALEAAVASLQAEARRTAP